jgi:hypothetical protein
MNGLLGGLPVGRMAPGDRRVTYRIIAGAHR